MSILNNQTAVYTGTFDPIHLDHLDVITRGCRIFKQLVIGVGINPDKALFFTQQERVELKTHHWAVATLSLKNLFGTLPGICHGWPKNELHWRGIDNSIVDIVLTRTPDLAIVDGVIGMEGDGPLNGPPKPMGVLVMGSDLVAVDATCCRLMKLDPHKVGYLVLGQRKKLGLLGEPQIQQLGETIGGRAKPFATVAHFDAVRLPA